MNQKFYSEKRVRSVNEFLNFLENSEKTYEMFRGHSVSSYQLIPSIGRRNGKSNSHLSWHAFEDEMLLTYKKYAIQYSTQEPKNDIEWLVIGQHHGLATRLLDWTTNPLKALFFAVSGNDNRSGAVWCLTPRSWYDKLDDLKGIKCLEIYYPAQITTRLIAQEGCFTIHPLPEKFEKMETIEGGAKILTKEISGLTKIVIPKSEKDYIQYQLDKLGVNHRTLFPDLDGLSKHLMWKI